MYIISCSKVVLNHAVQNRKLLSLDDSLANQNDGFLPWEKEGELTKFVDDLEEKQRLEERFVKDT